jgi:4,5-DOPA dioxygenase extradiol
VLQVSIQPMLGPQHQFALGRALAPLREQGVLLIGSGSITHNLHDWHSYSEAKEAPYVRPFIGWVEQKLEADDLPALFDYRRQAPFAAQAHPTDEHLLPLYFAMGAAGGDQLGAQRINAGIDQGFLAMDIYRFDGADAAA